MGKGDFQIPFLENCWTYRKGSDDQNLGAGDIFLSLGKQATDATCHAPRAMNMQRISLAAREAARPLAQRSLSAAAASIPHERFPQFEWRRTWTTEAPTPEEQAQQAKHAAIQMLQRAQAKDSNLMAKVCEDLVAAVGANWKLEITTSAHEHGVGQHLAK